MSRFDGLARRLNDAVDRKFGETFEFLPMVDTVNGKPLPDPDRQSLADVTAIYDDVGRVLNTQGQVPDRASTQPRISVQARFLPQGVKRLDRFIRTCNGKTLEVKHPLRDDSGRIEFVVVECGARP